MFDNISLPLISVLVLPLCLAWFLMFYIWRNPIYSKNEKIIWIFILATFPIVSIPIYFVYTLYRKR